MAQHAPSAVAPARETGPTHIRHIEGLRALAAYVVYINHAFAQAFEPGLPPKAFSFLTYSLVAGHLAVSVFIVISGFCLTLPVVQNGGQLKGGAWPFLRRRARRILPPYYSAVALCLVLIWTILGKSTGTLWDFSAHVTVESVIAHVFLVQNLFATSRINYVFWSIAVEFQIYLLFPGLVWLWSRRGAAVTVLAALLFGYTLLLAFADTRLARAAPHFIGLFTLGMLAAYMARSTEPRYVRWRERFRWDFVAIAALAIVVALCWRWGWVLAIGRFGYLDFPMAVWTAAILVYTSSAAGRVTASVLAWRPLVFIGTFSYSLYLIHAPLLQAIWQYIVRPANLGSLSSFAFLMGPGALLVLCASYGFFRAFEQPFMRQPKQKDVTQPPQATARFVA
jgi:peptidoglycan/LPS O-acetylase OafA/YrhL